MASSVAVAAVRRLAPKLSSLPTATSGARQYSNDYLHAEHMYNITAMKNRKVKMFFGVFGSLAIGTFVPILAVGYQLKKTSL